MQNEDPSEAKERILHPARRVDLGHEEQDNLNSKVLSQHEEGMIKSGKSLETLGPEDEKLTYS